MSQVGVISVKVVVENSDAEAKLGKTSRSVKQMGTNLRASMNTWAKWGAAGAAAAVAVAAAIFKSTASNIDSLAKTADKLGLATDKLVGLRFAAEQTGIAQDTLDMALQRSTRRIAEAAQGTGEAVKALDTLGLSAEDLAKKSPDEQMRDIADAMMQVEGEGNKLALAFKLFDSEGAALVNTLAGGSAALDDFQSRADAMGIALSRIDAAKVEQANDALNEVKKVLTGAAQSATVELAPIVTALASKFTNMAIEAGGFGAVAKNVFTGIINIVAKLADMLRGVQVAGKVVEVGFLGLGAAIVKSGTTILIGWSNIFETIGMGLRGLIETANKLPLVNIPTDGLDSFTASLQAEQDALKAMGDVSVKAVKDASAELQELAMRPLPSTAIQQFADEALSIAQARADAIAEIRASAGAETVPDADSALIVATKAESEAFLEELRVRYLTAAEIRQEAHDAELAQLQAARENMTLTDEEYFAQKAQLERAYAKESERIAAEEQSLKQRIIGAGGDSLLSTLAAQGNKSTAVQRIAAKAQAGIAIATGIAKAQALGFPANIAEAARVALVGSQVMSKIGGGGGSSISPGGGSTSSSSSGSVATAPVTSAPVAQTAQAISITLNGDERYSPENVRNLIESINSQTADGVQLNATIVGV